MKRHITASPSKNNHMKMIIIFWQVLALLIVTAAEEGTAAKNGEVLYKYQKQCPPPSSDSRKTRGGSSNQRQEQQRVWGYTTLSDLNLEMKYHSSLLAAPLNEEPQPIYEYTLCPGVIFDGSQQLTPLLDQTYIRCGNSVNDSSNSDGGASSCIIRGGKLQVLMIDMEDEQEQQEQPANGTQEPQLQAALEARSEDWTPIPRRLFFFEGITFEQSEDISIAAFAGPSVIAEFRNCHWKKANGSAAIYMTRGHPVALSSGNPDVSFRFDNVFDNNNRHNRFLTEDSDAQEGAKEGEDDYQFTSYEPGSTSTSPFTPGGSFVVENPEPYQVSSSASMRVVLRGCSFSHSGHDSKGTFRTIFNNEGTLETYDTVFNNNQGLFVINVFAGGSYHGDSTQFGDNRVTSAVVRGLNDATCHLTQPVFSNNTGSLATIAAMGHSHLDIQEGFFEDNDPTLADVVLFDRAGGAIYGSCWDEQGIIVDITSFLDQYNNYMGESSSEYCESDGQTGNILIMKDDWQCYQEQKKCPGICVEMTESTCSLRPNFDKSLSKSKSSTERLMPSLLTLLGTVFAISLTF